MGLRGLGLINSNPWVQSKNVLRVPITPKGSLSSYDIPLRVQVVLIYGFLVPIKAPKSLNNEYLDP